MDLKEIRWVAVDLIELAQDREKWQTLVKNEMKLWDLKVMKIPLKISFAVAAVE